jgi:uncharacterized protein YkwD
MKRFLLVIFCFIVVSTNAQIVPINGDIDRANELINNRIVYSNKNGWEIDYDRLNYMIGRELNKLRKSSGINQLKGSDKCKDLSTEQSEYMIRTGNFSHEREYMDFTTRVRSIVGKGHFGENLFHETTPVPTGIYEDDYKRIEANYPGFNFMWESNRANYQDLSKWIIKKWIESPPHYRNLINPLWNYFSVSSVSNNKEIYITLIFEE